MIGRGRLVGLALALALAVGAPLLPESPDLPGVGQRALGIVLATIVLWIIGWPQPEIASVLMMAALVLVGVAPTTALAGWGDTTLWLVAGGMCYGAAMARTGLMMRVALWLLKPMRPTYPRLIGAFFVLGILVSLAVPSISVRVLTIMPLIWGLMRALDLSESSPEGAFVLLGAYMMITLPGPAFLTGSLYGPIVTGLLPPAAKAQATWPGWFQVFGPPALLITVIMALVVGLILRPRRALPGRDRLLGLARDLGPIKRPEAITLAVLAASVMLWLLPVVQLLPFWPTGWLALLKTLTPPAFVVPMLGLVALFLTGVLLPKDFETAPNWRIIGFIAGITSMAAVINGTGIKDWVGKLLAPALTGVAATPVLFVALVVLVTYGIRMLDVTGTVTPALIVAPLAPVVAPLGISPLVLAAASVLASMTFLVEYQSFWIVAARGVLPGRGWTAGQQLRLAGTHAVVALAVIAGSVVYWQALGLVP